MYLFIKDWLWVHKRKVTQFMKDLDNRLFYYLPKRYRYNWHMNHHPYFKALIDMDPNYFNIGDWDDVLNQRNGRL